MITTFSQPLLPQDRDCAAGDLKALLLEPLFIIGASLFWLAILPLTALFCVSVALFDKVASFKSGKLRLPDLRSNHAHNPLLLRKKGAPQQKGHLHDTAPAFQS